MKDLLFKLLKLETTQDNLKMLNKAIEVIQKQFNKYDVFVKQYEKNGKPSIVVTTKPGKKPKIMLNGHIDVVPAEYENAFVPKEKDGRIFARGASDMKGAVVAMITAFTELIEEGKDLDLGIMITSDEEIGGFNGVEYLVNEEKYAADVAFVPDAGPNWQICTDEKAVWHFKVIGRGKSAHGSNPWEGENAVNKCWKTYTDIRDEFRNQWGKLRENDSWKPTINLGSLHGGNAANKVPDYAEMEIDIRFNGDVKKEEIEKIVFEAVKKRGTEFQNYVFGYANHNDKNNQYIKYMVNLLAEKLGKEPNFLKSHGGSDARHFSAKGIPVVMTSPIQSPPHVTDEWVDFQSLVEFKELTKKWILISNFQNLKF